MTTVHRHSVQFYIDETFFSADLLAFVLKALQANEAVIVAATREHSDMLLADLKRADISVADLESSGRLTLLDATHVMRQITVQFWPDARRFEQVIGTLVAEKTRAFGRVAVYGEIVNVLWQQGYVRAAVRLEELWNRLQERYGFRLACGYKIDLLDVIAAEGTLSDVCRTHDRVMPGQEPEKMNEAFQRALAEVLPAHVHALSHEGDRMPAHEGLEWITNCFPQYADEVRSRTRRYLNSPEVHH